MNLAFDHIYKLVATDVFCRYKMFLTEHFGNLDREMGEELYGADCFSSENKNYGFAKHFRLCRTGEEDTVESISKVNVTSREEEISFTGTCKETFLELSWRN